MESITKLPGYRIEVEIGRGGMATVYLATQESLARTVALKIISPGLMHDPTARERFLKEGKIIAQLNHPNIITVHDIGHAGSIYYMAMEYIEGGNLSTRIQQGMSVEFAFHITRQVAEALEYAHKKGYIHRDVKPANVLFKEDDCIVLSDFGIAKALNSETTLTGIDQSIGTPEYMSPERVRGKYLDARSDLYSLGVVLYQMLTQQQPFKGDDSFSTAMSHISNPVPRLPEQLARYQILIDRLLAKEPQDRFATAGQLIETLDELPAQKARTAELSRTVVRPVEQRTLLRQDDGAETGPRIPSLNKRLIGVALSAVLVIGIGGLSYWHRSSDVDPQTQKITEVLLAQAQRHIAASRLTAPAGDNAYQSYRMILEFDPHNEQALNGIEKIADESELQARAKRDAGRLNQALALAARGLQVDPGHSGLLALQKEILWRQEQERQRNQDIADLLAQAQSQLDASRFLAPPNDNALQSYRQILAIDTDNKAAAEGLDKIVTSIEQRALSEYRQGDIEQSLSLLSRALEAFPEREVFSHLHAKIAREQEQNREAQKLEALFARAETQIGASRYTLPGGDNALETYKAILSLDPHNQRATAGLAVIADHCESQASLATSEGRYDEALTAVNEGLKAAPDQENLLVLQGQLERIKEHTERRNALLSELVAQAEVHLAASRFTQPDGDNAYETFREILAVDPQHEIGAYKLARITSDFEKRARADQQSGRYEQSLSLIRQSLELQPHDSDLIDLSKEVEAQLNTLRRKQRIERLIAKAQQQFAASRWTQPQGDNAFETYQELLAVSPRNGHAQSGLRDIADGYFKRGYLACEKGALQDGLASIHQGLLAVPDHPRLLALREVVIGRMRGSGGKSQEALLNEAQRQFQASRLIKPQGNNAYETYLQVLLSDPDNARAKAGLQAIAIHYETLAVNKRRAGDLQGALEMVKLGLQVDPDYAGLLKLQNEIESGPQKPSPEGDVANLLATARQRIEDGRYMHPEGDNALEIYRQILEIDPQNPTAREGLQTMAAYYEARAIEKRHNGDLKGCLTIVEEGLSILPEHPGLLALRDDLAQRLESERGVAREW